MELPPPFVWYDIVKDYITEVPEECYFITFTFTIGIFIFLVFLAKTYPSQTLRMIQYFLGKCETSEQIPLVVVNVKGAIGKRASSPAPRGSTPDEKEKNYATRRKKAITEEYKKFAPSVLNILGKEISAQDKFLQLISKVEDLSVEALIGYDWEKKMNKNIGSLVKRYYPEEYDDNSVEIG